MGYYTRLTGEIYTSPPISWKEAKDTIWAQQNQREDELTLEMFEETVPTELDGEYVQVVRRTFTHVRPTWDDGIKAYKTEQILQDIVDFFPGHEWSGYIEGVGEEYPDVWRLYVKNGVVNRVEPKIVWPED
jgi:hypothetical protein